MLTLSPDVDGRESFERSFDFSKFPNIQQINFGVHWVHGGLHWIVVALSTLKPTTSPRLSKISLSFGGPSLLIFLYYITGTMNLRDLGNDLQFVAEEFARIEREYQGAVRLTVHRTSEFAQLDRLNVSISVGWMEPCSFVGLFYSLLAGSSALGQLRWDLRAPFPPVSPDWTSCGIESSVRIHPVRSSLKLFLCVI